MISKIFFESQKVSDEKIKKLKNELEKLLPNSFLQYDDKGVKLHMLSSSDKDALDDEAVEKIFDKAYNKYIVCDYDDEDYKQLYDKLKSDVELLKKRISILEKK